MALETLKGVEEAEALIEAAKTILDGLNKQAPCLENRWAIVKLEEALQWLKERGIEGTSKA